ncbi:MAG: RNA methyltransferase [Hyphomonadaceae bacterium]
MTNKKSRNRPFNAKGPRGPQPGSNEPVWLWGIHAVMAALANPKRKILRVIATPNAIKRGGLDMAEEMKPRDIDALLPSGAVHQGIAAQMRPLQSQSLEDMIAAAPRTVAVLDQVSDPHNLGAVLRSAAAFAVDSIVLQTRHSPAMTGIVAKSAAGAVEMVAETRVVNIARALEQLADAGYCTIGLAGEADGSLAARIPAGDKLALVFGAEGAGLRPAVAKACMWQARIEMAPQMESLNISNAAAIAFYQAHRSNAVT